jgi:tRNA A37 methylthiotransferase MiaB
VIVTGCLGARADEILERHPQVLEITGAHALEEVVTAVHKHLPPLAKRLASNNTSLTGRLTKSPRIEGIMQKVQR